MLAARIKKQLGSPGTPSLSLDVEVTAAPGITVLFGPSGAGKTSVLRAIAGIITPDEGSIVFDDRIFFDSGKGINLPIQHRRVGFVFQDHALFPHLTAEQNVLYGTKDGRSSRVLVSELLSLLEIEKARKRYPYELSGGEKQRVALARALASEPLIMLLDEPLSAVDFATRSHLLGEITAIQRKTGIPFLYITHNHSEAVRVGDYLYLMRAGEILQAGPPLQVLNAPRTLPAAQAAGTENIFMGEIRNHKASDGLSTVALRACQIDISYNGLPIGTPVTLGIRSEDILLARTHLTGTSARNILEGRIINIISESDKAELVVDCGEIFKVSITPMSIRELSLSMGATVYLLIKARACHLLT